MADVKVRTMDVELRTCKLTKSLLKQFRVVEFQDARPLLETGKVLGWVHGTVLDGTDDYWRWLIIQTGPGDYIRYRCYKNQCEKYPQIYIV